MSEPTPDQVIGLWQYMQSRYHSTIIHKGDAIEMKVVASLLDLLGIEDKTKFLTHFATTIGHRIYVPFVIGVEDSVWTLWKQMIVCAHEHQHIVQHNREMLRFELLYLKNTADRARYEAEAYRATLELNWWRSKTLPDLAALASKLTGYGCKPGDVAVAQKSLELSAVSIKQGGILNEASGAVINWLAQHAANIRS